MYSEYIIMLFISRSSYFFPQGPFSICSENHLQFSRPFAYNIDKFKAKGQNSRCRKTIIKLSLFAKAGVRNVGLGKVGPLWLHFHKIHTKTQIYPVKVWLAIHCFLKCEQFGVRPVIQLCMALALHIAVFDVLLVPHIGLHCTERSLLLLCLSSFTHKGGQL